MSNTGVKLGHRILLELLNGAMGATLHTSLQSGQFVYYSVAPLHPRPWQLAVGEVGAALLAPVSLLFPYWPVLTFCAAPMPAAEGSLTGPAGGSRENKWKFGDWPRWGKMRLFIKLLAHFLLL